MYKILAISALAFAMLHSALADEVPPVEVLETPPDDVHTTEPNETGENTTTTTPTTSPNGRYNKRITRREIFDVSNVESKENTIILSGGNIKSLNNFLLTLDLDKRIEDTLAQQARDDLVNGIETGANIVNLK
jgi:hypothetical protein